MGVFKLTALMPYACSLLVNVVPTAGKHIATYTVYV